MREADGITGGVCQDAKDEWIARLKSRRSDKNLVKFIQDNWETLVGDYENQTRCRKVFLKEGQYLSDIMEDLAEQMSKPPSRKP
ncbi:hypothetical protein MGU_10217 [Metarhizium guizhouense ARSEF 977]|uniref:Uncharacterized protein n=1 Tax=Metarhizium guizhouense (strain ARSEF 977) TaxID=1276136 RepID=A0A0B4GIZ1_METGA|nr:hypothetical protein MGU_10217 [Metarhizium guizhouense ARSEF 977]